jgi:3-hydroxyisobutyrate dehydrogenase-like beta-hydroxyacid dehydrogenase
MLSTDSPARIGLIGLGLMGQALAERLKQTGACILGWDVLDPARTALQAGGGAVASSAAEVFATCPVVILSLPDSHIVAQVLAGIVDLADRIIIDTSTGDPEDAESIASSVAGRGGHYLDATISGSSAQLAQGDVTLMVGGDAATVAACRPLLDHIGHSLFHVGPPGSGARMKLVTNLVLGLNRAALAEGLALARVLGLDAQQALEVMRGSMAYSRIMDTKGQKMISGDFTPQAKLSQHLKDVRLMLQAAATRGQNLPLSQAHRSLLEKAEAMGYGQQDNSALLRAYD